MSNCRLRQLEHYSPERQVVVKASLVTSDGDPKPHVHKLMGKNCLQDGTCIMPLSSGGTAEYVR